MGKKLLISILISMIVCSAVLIEHVSSEAIAKPTQLKIYVSPPNIPSDNSAYNCISVQLQDSNGNPARAQQDTTISLSSSLTEIGTVDPSINIQNGATYATANFYTTFTPGATTVTAAATGYATVQETVTTIGPKPYKIAVYGFPAFLPADGGSYEAIMVQLQDSTGSPAKAPNGGTQVTLSCSNTIVGDVSPTVSIPEGQTYALASFTTTTVSGRADITPVAGDYTSQDFTIETKSTMSSRQLRIFTGPAKVLADNIAYRQIAVEIIDDKNNLGVAPSDITVTIATNDESIGKTEARIIIPQSKSYALATITTTYKAGTTTITAAATNYIAASQTITTTGYTASKLAVYLAPSTLPADKKSYQAVQVQLQDAEGRPAKAPEDLTVNLFSSQPTVGTMGSTIEIPMGKTWATETLNLTNSPGETTVTAQAAGYTTGQGKITTCMIDISRLSISVAGNPQAVSNGNQTEITAYITVEGSPITGATVEFTTDNNGTFTATQEGQSGYYKTTFTAPSFSETTVCTITANGSKTGYLASQGTTHITVVLPSNSTAIVNSTTSNANIGELRMRIQDIDGNYLSDVNVYSTTEPAGSAILSGYTNGTGYITFKNVLPGAYTFEIMKAGYETLSLPINFNGDPLAMALTLYDSAPQGDNTLVTIIAVVAIVVVIAVIGIALVKRRKQPEKTEPLDWPLSLN